VPNARRGRPHVRLRPKIRYDPSLSSTRILGTAGICIALTWRGLYTPQAAAFQNNKSATRFFMPAIFRKKVARLGKSTMQSEQRSRPSPASNRSAERAAPLWTARRTAARPRIACRSRFAALYLVRRCFTASAPALGPLCSVTPAGCASGGSRSCTTVRIWVRRLRPKNVEG